MPTINKPLDTQVVEILRLLQRAGGDCFLIGAMARQILLSNVHGQPPGRATVDLDFAVAVESWDVYAAIKQRLIQSSERMFQGPVAHRLLYRIPADPKIYEKDFIDYPVDIIPFQGVEDRHGVIKWPLDAAIHMCVSGYRETSENTVEVQIDANLSVRVASLAAVAMLKIFAWHDRWMETKRDAQDIATILRQYGTTGNNGRPYEDAYLETLQRYDYDPDIIWAWLLGQDIRSLASPETLAEVLAIFDDDGKLQRLLQHMAPFFPGESALESAVTALKDGMANTLVVAP